MDGILIIDKPAGITSHDVVAHVRRTLKTRRVGHTGTLDPFATGVMVILVGRATRLAQFLDKDEKEYEAVVLFGYETDTGDVTGTPIGLSEPGAIATGFLAGQSPTHESAEKLATLDWERTLSSFRGKIDQTPPMYSAKKVAGKKLYEHARKGEVIDRQPVKVVISKLEIIKGNNPVAPAPGSDTSIRIRVVCSAGTYIRQLAEDIGRKVGVGAHLAELRRTRAGRFGLAGAVTLDELDKADNPLACLLQIETAVEHLPVITLAPDRVEKTRNGLSTRVEATFEPGEPVQMRDDDGGLIAIGIFDQAENAIRPKVVLV